MEAGHRRHDISDKDWEKLLDVLIEDPDYEWLMIDASHGKT